MAPKRYTKRSGKIRGKKAYKKKARVGYSRSFSALAPPRYEKKYVDTALSAAMLEYSGTGVIQNDFVLMTNGTGNGARIGDRITVTNINCHLQAKTGSSVTSPGAVNTLVRVILGIDKQCNGGNTVVQDVLQAADAYSFRNMQTLNRFVILKDKLFTLNPSMFYDSSGTDYIGVNGRVLKFSWKGQLPIMYDGTGANIAQVMSNNIFLLVVADRTAIAGQVDGVDGIVRIKYTDA